MSDSSDDDMPLAQRNGAGGIVAKKFDSATQKPAATNAGSIKPEVKQHSTPTAPPSGVKPAAPASAAKLAAAGNKDAAAAPRPVKKENGAVKKEAGGRDSKPADKKAAAKAVASKGEGAGKARAPKKEYDLPGQTRETPDDGEPLAKFYMSLLKQRPDSEIANKWCIQHGLCSKEHAEVWLAKNGKATASPLKRPPAATKKAADAPARKPAAPKRPPPAKVKKPAPKRGDRVFDDDDEDDSEEEALPISARAKPKAPAAAPARKPAPKPAAKPAADNDSSDEDDMPLAKRARL